MTTYSNFTQIQDWLIPAVTATTKPDWWDLIEENGACPVCTMQQAWCGNDCKGQINPQNIPTPQPDQTFCDLIWSGQ